MPKNITSNKNLSNLPRELLFHILSFLIVNEPIDSALKKVKDIKNLNSSFHDKTNELYLKQLLLYFEGFFDWKESTNIDSSFFIRIEKSGINNNYPKMCEPRLLLDKKLKIENLLDVLPPIETEYRNTIFILNYFQAASSKIAKRCSCYIQLNIAYHAAILLTKTTYYYFLNADYFDKLFYLILYSYYSYCEALLRYTSIYKKIFCISSNEPPLVTLLFNLSST